MLLVAVSIGFWHIVSRSPCSRRLHFPTWTDTPTCAERSGYQNANNQIIRVLETAAFFQDSQAI